MSKVICDVCGTAFPETAAQCPICGSAKTSSAQTAAGGSHLDGEDTTAYTYVKGGRFSKSNVRKRNTKSAAPQRRASKERQPQKKQNDQEETANRALVVVVILLLLAIIAVVIYIAVRVIGPVALPPAETKPVQPQSTQPTTPTETKIPCTALQTTQFITLNAVGDTWLIQVDKLPAETTDTVIFESADTSVATVTDAGLVEAVAEGQTTITITCGEVSQTCTIVVGDGEGEQQPTQPPTEPVDPDFELKFKKTDVTLNKKGQTWRAYDGEVSPLEIVWVSDDPSICTIDNGVVTAVSAGTTRVHAQYAGQTATCIIRCSSDVGKNPTSADPGVKISHTDVTISINQSFTLTLKDAGETVTAQWAASKNGIVTISGNKITGAAKGTVTVKYTYEGNTYECIVRVKG